MGDFGCVPIAGETLHVKRAPGDEGHETIQKGFWTMEVSERGRLTAVLSMASAW